VLNELPIGIADVRLNEVALEHFCYSSCKDNEAAQIVVHI
jgi:hypothetical protein